MRWLVVCAALVACKSPAEKQCAAMTELAERCLPAKLPLDDMETYCTMAVTMDRGSGRNAAVEMAEAMEDCSRQTTCDALNACFERRKCRFVMANATATPQFSCW